MWDIWANQLLPKALKWCPKYNKSPDLVTLAVLYETIMFLFKNGIKVAAAVIVWSNVSSITMVTDFQLFWARWPCYVGATTCDLKSFDQGQPNRMETI